MKRLHVIVCLSALVFGVAVRGQDMVGLKAAMKARMPRLAALKKSQVIGENRQGLIELVKPGVKNEEAQRLVDAENADRRTLYAAIAAKTGGALDQVGRGRAKEIYARAKPGLMLQREDGTWYAR